MGNRYSLHRLDVVFAILTNMYAWGKDGIGQYHSLGLGSDRNLYACGNGIYGQFGDGTTANRDRSVQAALSGPGTPKGVDCGTVAGTVVTARPDGSWLVDAFAHLDGSVPVTIRWTRNGAIQVNDTNTTYRFVAILPLAGLVLLLAGPLTMAGTLLPEGNCWSFVRQAPEVKPDHLSSPE